jgi:phospholipid-transporting ATPase
MAGNPQNNDLLLDLDDQGRNYGNPGRPPATSEEEYAHRMSTSYDDFVGSSAGISTHQYPGDLDPPHGTFAPTHRTYSQTSVLDNYQPYYDEVPDDGRPTSGYHYGHSGGGGSGGDEMAGSSANRHSIVGRVKSALGMNPEYSEMDLPLTETRPRDAIAGVDDSATPRPQPKENRKSDGFKFGFGRRKVDPSTLGPRVIHLNNPPSNAANKYLDNHVSTAKYNVATFLPKFLYEQFSKYANLFFLFTAGLQQIPDISPTNKYTTIGPLIVVLLVSAGKELVEDWKRKAQDKELNRSKTKVLTGSAFDEARWLSVRVGDIVRVESEEPFPADLILLASSEPEGLCYIETANLDGETNLKIKQAIPETANLVSPGDLSRLSGRIRSEQPNSSLYTYEGTLTMDMGGGEKELPLNPDQLLLRGATLRNTPWIYGIVVFTGHETKLMRNATATPIKRTAVERMVNVQIIMLVSILLALSVISSTGDVIKQVRWIVPFKAFVLLTPGSLPARQWSIYTCLAIIKRSNSLPIS